MQSALDNSQVRMFTQSICFVKRTTENDAVKLELDVDQVTEELIGSCDAARKAVDIACEPLKSTKKAKKA